MSGECDKCGEHTLECRCRLTEENGLGTWDYELQEHFKAFTAFCWEGLNASCNEMVEEGHEGKVPFYKWREYVIYDMQRRHDKEKTPLA